MSAQFINDHPFIRNKVNIRADQIVSPGFLDVRNPENDALSFVIYTGIALTPLAQGQPGNWIKTIVQIEINTGNGRKWTKNPDRGPGWTFLDSAVATAAPVSMINTRTSPCGWAVDDLRVDIQGRAGDPDQPPGDEYLTLLLVVAVFDLDTTIHRINYQVTAVGREM